MIIAMSILVVAILLGAAGQIALKSGLNRLGAKPSPVVVLKSIFTPLIFTGFACYGLSSILYLLALSRLELSYAYPMVALSYVVVTFLSWRLLGEAVPLLRTAGLAVICIGVILVACSYRGHAAAASRAPSAIERPSAGPVAR
ncbi:MAG: multidrug resistance protein [Armatimonadetes bacterium]|nr:multidrug resistance protein [Armatimonadota bacterium]